MTEYLTSEPIKLTFTRNIHRVENLNIYRIEMDIAGARAVKCANGTYGTH